MSSPMYREFADEYAAAITDNIYNAHFERPSLLAMLPDVSNQSVLDLGCGPGMYSAELLRRGAKVTAIDASPEMVDRVTHQLGEHVNAYVQDLSHGLPDEATASFDLVICPLTIHYIAELTPLFAEVQRVLKPGGLFVFSTHHPMVDFQDSPSGNYFKRELIVDNWHTLGRPVEVRFYRRSLSELFGALSQAGLCVVELNEGQPSEQLRELSPEHDEKLRTKPNFLFIKTKPV